MVKKVLLFTVLALFCGFLSMSARPSLKEICSASDNVLVVFIAGDSRDANAIDIEDLSRWKINGEPVSGIERYSTSADLFDHRIYLKTSKLQEGKRYRVETPYGDRDFDFREREIFCEAIKTNQVGYSAKSTRRYANFAIWLGTGGSGKIEGALPAYEVWNVQTGKAVATETWRKLVRMQVRATLYIASIWRAFLKGDRTGLLSKDMAVLIPSAWVASFPKSWHTLFLEPSTCSVAVARYASPIFGRSRAIR